MLSFGIRFGQGFDRMSVLKVMHSAPVGYDYDFIILGCNPGGVACAREAGSAGKKTALVKCNNFTPAENEGIDEDLEEMAVVLGGNASANTMHVPSVAAIGTAQAKVKMTPRHSLAEPLSDFSKVIMIPRSPRLSQNFPKRSRKVRKSKLDLRNELFKRGKQGRKLMRNAATLHSAVADAYNSGWRISAFQPPTINWNKMTEQVMDYVMKENWDLMTSLSEAGVEVIEGRPEFLNSHTVKISRAGAEDQEMTADKICTALPAESTFPEDVTGATDFGITCEDFIRMSEPPGKTLIVGSSPEGLECAGVVACCRYPVTVVSRSKLLKGYDTEMSGLIVENLKKLGVSFLEYTALTEITLTSSEGLLAKFVSSDPLSEEPAPKEEEFDTVIFAVGTKTSLDFLSLNNAGIEFDPECQKIKANEFEETSVPNIYSVGEVTDCRPEGFEISEFAGKLLGRRLFKNGTEIMDYTMCPSVIYTPLEYAFVGMSEDSAMSRLGEDCVDIYYGYFKPLEFVLPPRKENCYTKVIVYKATDLVLGLHLFGPEAGEVIQGFAVAFKTGLKMTQLHSAVGVHASKAQEILKLKETKKKKVKIELEEAGE